MNRLDLVRKVADRVGVSQEEVGLVLLEVLRELAEAIRLDGGVALRSFGTFHLKERAARVGRDPRDGSPIPIPPKKTVVFKPSELFEEYVAVPRGRRPRRRIV